MNICSIDISKAFDKTNHYGVLLKLLKRHTPSHLVDLLQFWLSNCWTCIKWNNCFSDYFCIEFGVRQGSVLSPILFAIYLDDFFNITSTNHCIIMYADDILILAPSVTELQRLFHHCENELIMLDMAINEKKSFCLRIGPRFQSQCVRITSVNGFKIEWVNKIKYLGIFIETSTKFKCCTDYAKRSFFRSLNAIYGKIGGCASEEVVLQLMYSKCIPVLIYAFEVCNLSKRSFATLDFSVTRFLMKLFKTNNIETINSCIDMFNIRLPSVLINTRAVKFLDNLSKSDNILCKLCLSFR